MPVYLDTSALVRRAEANGPAPSERNEHAGEPVADLLLEGGSSVATSEVGLVEFHDVVTQLWRDTNPPYDVYDEAWWKNSIALFMSDVAKGKLEIRVLPPRILEGAMSLVTLAMREHGTKFRVWDAVHLITAVDWSLEIGQRCELWTSDEDFVKFVQLFTNFDGYVTVRNLDT